MEEVWKDSPGYEGMYQVSNLGQVRSYGRYCNNRYNKVWRPGRILSAGKDNKGYLTVVLCLNDTRHTVKVHRLVAELFIDNPENKDQVNHINGNKQENCVANLEWCTQSENMMHAWQIGLQSRVHKKNDSRSFKVTQHNDDMEIVGKFPSMMEAERQTGINGASIARAAKKGGRAGGYFWKYA